MSDFGIKVSKSGKDVTTAASDELQFDSSYASDLVEIFDFVTVNHSGVSSTVTIPHNLGEARPFIVYDAQGATQLPVYQLGYTPYGNDAIITPRIDDTNLYVDITLNASADYFTYFIYMIFAKPL